MAEDLPKHTLYWLSEAKPDCFFLVGLESGITEKIGALRTLLTGYSEPFRAMLQDSKLAERGDVRLIDVEPGTFRNFLKCLYGGSEALIPELSFDESAKLLYVAEKYLVQDVKDEVSDHIYEIWSPNKIFLALSHPVCLNEEILYDSVLDVLQKGFLEIAQTKEFINLSEAAITFILEQRQLNVEELEIWNGIVKWATYRKKSDDGKVLRPHISPFLKYIRFMTISYKDFCGVVIPSGILNKDEINEILQSYGTGHVPNIEYLCKSKEHRCILHKESMHIVRDFLEIPKGVIIFYKVNNISSLNSNPDYSKPVMLDGFFWQLKIQKETISNQHYFSIHILPESKNYLRGWPNPVEYTCNIHVRVTVLNQMFQQKDVSNNFLHEFSVKDHDKGWKQFILWNELIAPEKGFVKDDAINILATL